MAARLNLRHQDMVREKIRASQLINRLQDYALTDPTDEKYTKKAMADSQVRAAMGLLAKCVPDLNRTEMTGKDGKDLAVTIIGAVGDERI